MESCSRGVVLRHARGAAGLSRGSRCNRGESGLHQHNLPPLRISEPRDTKRRCDVGSVAIRTTLISLRLKMCVIGLRIYLVRLMRVRLAFVPVGAKSSELQENPETRKGRGGFIPPSGIQIDFSFAASSLRRGCLMLREQ